MDEYISLAELSERISLGKRTLRELVRRADNPLPAFQVGNKLLFSWATVDAWLESQKVQTVDTDAMANEIVHKIKGAKHGKQ